LPKGLKL